MMPFGKNDDRPGPARPTPYVIMRRQTLPGQETRPKLAEPTQHPVADAGQQGAQQAAQTAYLARMEFNLDQQLTTLAGQYADDPAGFQISSQKSREKFLQQIQDHHQRQRAAMAFDLKAQKHQGQIEHHHRQAAIQQNELDLRTAGDHFLNQATQAIHSGAGDEAVEAFGKYETTLTALLANGSIDPKQRIAMRNQASDALLMQRIQGNFERALAKGRQEADRFIADISKNNTAIKGAKDDAESQRYQKIVNLLKRRLKAALADRERESKRSQQRAEKILNEQQQAVFSGLLPRLNAEDSALTQGELDGLLDDQELSPTLYEQLSKALNATEADADDPQGVVQLYRQLDQDRVTAHEVAVDAVNLYAAGRMTKETLDKVLTRAAKAADESFAVKDYRRLARQAAATLAAGDAGKNDSEKRDPEKNDSGKALAEIRVSDEYDQRLAAGEAGDAVFKSILDRRNAFRRLGSLRLISAAQADGLEGLLPDWATDEGSIPDSHTGWSTIALIIRFFLLFKKVKKLFKDSKKPREKNKKKKNQSENSDNKQREARQRDIEQEKNQRQKPAQKPAKQNNEPSKVEYKYKRLKDFYGEDIYDDDGYDYVIDKKESPDLGEIDQEIVDAINQEIADAINRGEKAGEKIESGPIRLRKGGHNDKTGRGVGQKHIEQKHWEEIEKAGFEDVVEFIRYVAKNFNHIYRDKANGRLILVKRNGKDKILVIELEKIVLKKKAGQKEIRHWTVITGGVREKRPSRWVSLWARAPKKVVPLGEHPQHEDSLLTDR